MSTVFITGANKGIGLEAVRFIAARGGLDIVMAGRSAAEMERVAATLRAEFKVNVKTLMLDVSSMKSVRDGAQALKVLFARGEVGPLWALMFNAGVQSLKGPEYTVDGYEQTFATNCLGHFLLTNLLLDHVEDGGRIVWTASGTHDPTTTDGKLVGRAVHPDADTLAHTGKNTKALSGGVRYSTSKLCEILYSYELERRLRKGGSKVQSIAYDPGYIPETGLGRAAPTWIQWFSKTGFFKRVFRLLGGTLGDLSFSGSGLGSVAVDPQYSDAGGKFIQSKNRKLSLAKSSPGSYDIEAAAKLWRDSERLVSLQSGEGAQSIR